VPFWTACKMMSKTADSTLGGLLLDRLDVKSKGLLSDPEFATCASVGRDVTPPV
jgi:hypothetical protein